MNAGTSQQFCVRWNSHLGSLGAAFPQLLASQRFVDVTLACEGHQLHCHRLVLAACSTYFESVLNENPCKHPIIILPRDIRLWEIQALVDFMYKGEVNVSQAGLSDLLKCAEIFQIRGLCGSDAALNLDQINATSSPTAQSSAMPAGSTQSAAAAAAENSPGVTGSTTRSSSTNQQQTGTTAGATLAIATSSSSSSSSTSSTTSSSSTSSSSTPASTSTKDINNQNRNLVNRTKNTISSNNDNHSSNSSSNNRAAAASASTVAGINPNLSTTLPNVATAELSNSSFLNLTRGKLNAHKNDLQRYNTSTPNHSIISKTEPIDDEPMDDDLDDNSNNDSMDILGAVDKTDDEFTEYIKGSSKLQAEKHHHHLLQTQQQIVEQQNPQATTCNLDRDIRFNKTNNNGTRKRKINDELNNINNSSDNNIINSVNRRQSCRLINRNVNNLKTIINNNPDGSSKSNRDSDVNDVDVDNVDLLANNQNDSVFVSTTDEFITDNNHVTIVNDDDLIIINDTNSDIDYDKNENFDSCATVIHVIDDGDDGCSSGGNVDGGGGGGDDGGGDSLKKMNKINNLTIINSNQQQQQQQIEKNTLEITDNDSDLIITMPSTEITTTSSSSSSTTTTTTTTAKPSSSSICPKKTPPPTNIGQQRSSPTINHSIICHDITSDITGDTRHDRSIGQNFGKIRVKSNENLLESHARHINNNGKQSIDQRNYNKKSTSSSYGNDGDQNTEIYSDDRLLPASLKFNKQSMTIYVRTVTPQKTDVENISSYDSIDQQRQRQQRHHQNRRFKQASAINFDESINIESTSLLNDNNIRSDVISVPSSTFQMTAIKSEYQFNDQEIDVDESNYESIICSPNVMEITYNGDDDDDDDDENDIECDDYEQNDAVGVSGSCVRDSGSVMSHHRHRNDQNDQNDDDDDEDDDDDDDGSGGGVIITDDNDPIKYLCTSILVNNSNDYDDIRIDEDMYGINNSNNTIISPYNQNLRNNRNNANNYNYDNMVISEIGRNMNQLISRQTTQSTFDLLTPINQHNTSTKFNNKRATIGMFERNLKQNHPIATITNINSANNNNNNSNIRIVANNNNLKNRLLASGGGGGGSNTGLGLGQSSTNLLARNSIGISSSGNTSNVSNCNPYNTASNNISNSCIGGFVVGGSSSSNNADPSPSAVVLRNPRSNQPRTYSNDALYAALMDVKSGESIYRASQIHKVPRKTLRNWMKRWDIKSAYPMPRQLKQAAEKKRLKKIERIAESYEQIKCQKREIDSELDHKNNNE